MKQPHLILASASPRRRELLARVGYAFEICSTDAAESMPRGAEPAQAAMHNAQAKARTAARQLEQQTGRRLADRGALVLGADTVVALDGRIWGKPHDEEAAAETLRALSGRTHEVVTGVCLAKVSPGDGGSEGGSGGGPEGAEECFAERTRVTFRALSDAEIADYIACGESLDKAGAYGIQGKGAQLVAEIEGDFDNVVGLPVAALSARLAAHGILKPES